MDEKNLSADDLNEDQMHILKRRVPENYYKYKLKGIVVHEGTADQGHYYSFIADRTNKNAGWFVFYDTHVRDLTQLTSQRRPSLEMITTWPAISVTYKLKAMARWTKPCSRQ